MSESIKDVSLKIAVATSGADQVNALAKQIDALAKEGGAAAPEFAKLAEELRKIGSQDQAAAALGKLESEMAATAAASSAARTEVAELDIAFQAQSKSAQSFRDQQVAIKGAVEQTAAQIRVVGGDLKLLQASTDAAGKGTEAYKAEVIALKTTLAELQNAQAGQKAELKAVNADTRDAEKALSSLSRSYDGAIQAASALGREFAQQKTDLNQAKVALKELDVTAVSFGAAAQEVATSMDRVRAETTRMAAAHDAAKASAAALAKAEQELQAALQFEAETAQRAVQYENEHTLAQERLAQAVRNQASAQASANQTWTEALNGAFGTAGVRSLEAIRSESVALERALNTIKLQFEGGNISAESFARGVAGAKVRLAELQREAATLPALPGIFEKMSSAIGGVITRFGALGASLGIFGLATKPVFDLALQVDTLRRSLTTITGSAAEAEKAIAFLRQTANFSGVSIGEVSDSFVRFTAALRTSGISAAETEKVFASVTNAAGNLGLSSDKVAHILDAIGQMANKGVISMEELRQQLGESLPGALGLMAKGLGITDQQLIKMVESGQLLTSRALGPLADALTALGSKDKQVEGLGASFNRLSNAMRAALQQGTDSTAFKQLAGAIDSVARNFGTLVDVTVGFGKAILAIKIVNYVKDFLGFGSAARIVATEVTAATAATVGNTVANTTNTTAVQGNTAARAANVIATVETTAAMTASAAATRAAATAAASGAASVGLMGGAMGLLGGATRGALGLLGGLPGLLLIIALNAKEMGTWLGESTAKLFGWGKAIKASEDALAAQAKAAKAAEDANRKVGDAWVQATVQYNTGLKAVTASILETERLVKAKKLEGEAITQIAQLTGSEASHLDAATKAAAGNEAATLGLFKAKEAEAALTEAYIEKLEAEGRAKGSLNSAERALLETLHQKLAVMKADAEAAREQVAANHAQATAAALASAAYKDNSGNLDKLREAYESVSTAAIINQRLAAEGVVTQEAVAQSTEAAAAAENLFRDAIDDSVKAAERQKAGAAVFAQLAGESAQALRLSADAAQNYTEKLNQTTVLLNQQTIAYTESRDAVLAEMAAHGDPQGNLAAEAARLQNLIELKGSETARATQATQAAKDEAAARHLAAEAYKDNSGRLGELMAAAHAASAELARLVELQKQGKATADQVAEATRNAATAQALYKDALHDTTVNLQNQILLDQAYANQLSAGLKLRGEQVKTEETLARIKGDDIALTNAQVKGMEVEIDVRKAQAQAMRQEADDTLALAEQERRELEQTGGLTSQKNAELEARIANAEAKRTEAAATGETVKQIEAEIEALKRLNAAKRAGNQYNKDGWAVDSNGSVISAKVVPDPWMDPDGNWFFTGPDGQLHRSQGQPVKDSNGNWQQPGGTNGKSGFNAPSGTPPPQFSSGGGATTDGPAGKASVADVPQATSSTHTVNITMGGATTAIGTASESDSMMLTNLLKQLGTASARAG